MSVAVAQMPQVFQGPSTQAAGQSDLLETLLASCRRPAGAEAKALPGFGRDLVPYFSPEEASVIPTAVVKSRSNNSSPQRSNTKLAAVATAMIAAAKKTPKLAAPKPSAKMTVAQAEKKRAVKMAALMSSWAGPGFCVSPTPDKLPTPTSTLLF